MSRSSLMKRKSLWLKDNKCFVCKSPIYFFDDCTLEHIIPLSKGGSNLKRNLSISHRECNRIKSDILCRVVFELKLSLAIESGDVTINRPPISRNQRLVSRHRRRVTDRRRDLMKAYLEKLDLKYEDWAYKIEEILTN